MSDEYLVEPDLKFIDNIVKLGGDSVKKCFQCATCSVACPIAPETSPFPRKEMLATSWGLKDKVLKSADIWLCHECGDCSDLCPRGARPGDVLSAARSATIEEYATPKSLSKLVNDPKKLHIVFGIPAIWFALMAFITVFCRGTMEGIFSSFGISWSHGVSPDKILAHTNFVSTWLVDATFVPLSIAMTAIFFMSLKNFIQDIHNNAVLEDKTKVTNVSFGAIFSLLPQAIKEILSHKQFKECGENQDRANSHMMLVYGFIACFITTAIAGISLYLFHSAGPYSMFNPMKWIGNVGGVLIVLGAFLMIQKRLADEDGKTTYKDWYLLGLVLGLGLTGLLTEFARFLGSASLTYFTYYLHLILVFNMFAFLPFSKFAHIVYRTVAIAYVKYSERT